MSSFYTALGFLGILVIAFTLSSCKHVHIKCQNFQVLSECCIVQNQCNLVYSSPQNSSGAARSYNIIILMRKQICACIKGEIRLITTFLAYAKTVE